MRAGALTCRGRLLADFVDSLAVRERSLVEVDGAPARPVVIRQFLKDSISGEFLIEVEDLETDSATGCTRTVFFDEISPVLRH